MNVSHNFGYQLAFNLCSNKNSAVICPSLSWSSDPESRQYIYNIKSLTNEPI